MKQEKLIIQQKDFKVWDCGIVAVNGVKYRLRKCEELIAGRWEGFVSLGTIKK